MDDRGREVAEAEALLAGRYRLVRQVGRGGMGVVWEAWDERLERPVAVKQLRPQLGLSPEDAELAKNRAMREARITARLHHRNAVPVFDVVEHEGQPCLIMQFLPSVPLSAELRDGGSLTVLDAARVGGQVASALAAAHALGIVHRDVKPGNILITDDGTALLSDFGISHALGDATLTSTGLVNGTPAYLAPEVARGASSSAASDVFSLGATLYTCLEGGPPFGTDPNSMALLYRVASGEFEPPRRAGALAPLLLEMLRPDPADRPPMSEVAARLTAVEAGDHDPSPSVPPVAPAVGATPAPTAVAQPAPVLPTVPVVEPVAPTAVEPSVVRAPESTWTTQVRRTEDVPAAAAPAVSPGARPPGRRRGARVLAAVALLVGLVVLGTAVVTGRLGIPSAGDPAPAGTPSGRATPRRSASASSDSTASSEPAEPSTSASRSPSASASSSREPSASPTPAGGSGTPTAAELEDAVTTYYGLVPDDTDAAWLLLTTNYQRTTSGGRQSYDNFWGQVESVKISNVDGRPPSRVDATLTYRRSSGTAVERTEFRLVRGDDGTLKIDGSTVLGRG